jgi:hypothetical protein
VDPIPTTDDAVEISVDVEPVVMNLDIDVGRSLWVDLEPDTTEFARGTDAPTEGR